MTEYKRMLERAMAEESRGHWRAARLAYVRAGQMLIEMTRQMDPGDWDAALESVRRLLTIAEKMKQREDQEQAQKAVQTGASKRSCASAEEDDEFEYLPSDRPNVRFEDIAGLAEPKRLIQEEIIEPHMHPEMYERFNQRAGGGVLLYGPPGTGKTMLARAIATETDADFFFVRCSDIVGKYFGEAERRIKALFNAARRSGNAIIFFDEIEALASKRGSHSTVMNRLIPELLSQMDGFEKHDGRLIIIGATNRPWDLDSAFLRPPRLTHHVYVPLPDYEARQYLIRRKLEFVPQQGTIDFDLLARVSEGFNCADVEELCNRATRGPIRRGVQTGNMEQYVTPADVEEAIQLSRSSVQPADLKAFAKWEMQKSA